MNTLWLFASGQCPIHPAAAWYLSDLGEYLGKQTLYTKQSPQRLKALRDYALIESTVSSNRIEGVTVPPARIKDVLAAPRPLFHDRNEEELRGYRDALAWIHHNPAEIAVSEDSIKRLHALARGQIWDAGLYKEKDSDIIERYADGTERLRFRTVTAANTAESMTQLVADWQACLEQRWVPPLIALAAFNLDFLCIHPFRDGNGRTSRLLLLLQSYHLGFAVGRYISLERLIEENKERYYATLELSSQGWHEGKHDPWPYLLYLMHILKQAYQEFAERVGEVKIPRGSKREQVQTGIERLLTRPSASFSLGELEQICPGVSRDMVRRVLREQQAAGAVECQSRGPAALWKKKG